MANCEMKLVISYSNYPIFDFEKKKNLPLIKKCGYKPHSVHFSTSISSYSKVEAEKLWQAKLILWAVTISSLNKNLTVETCHWGNLTVQPDQLH